jgi:hypothetical protein
MAVENNVRESVYYPFVTCVAENNVTGKLVCAENAPAPILEAFPPNIARKKLGQCATL